MGFTGYWMPNESGWGKEGGGEKEAWDRQSDLEGWRDMYRRGKAVNRGRGAIRGGEGETNYDGRVCAGVRALIRGGNGGTDRRRCVRSALVHTISIMARTVDSS